MDVSNSTGQNTSYRVLGGGTGTLKESELTGSLKPGQQETCPVADGKFWLRFFVDGTEVACATFHKAPEAVVLQEDEWGYRVQPATGKEVTS